MAPIVHPGRQLKRELTVLELSANRLAEAAIHGWSHPSDHP